MQIPIEKIQIREGRRGLDAVHLKELASSIQELGLLNPVTIDEAYTLIAGLHRLEAVKALGWMEIECTMRSLEGLKAELAEIDENFVRSGLSALEYGEMLLRRKEIYEALHPETKATYDGGPFRGNQHKNVVGDKMSATTKSFVRDTADKLGVVPRTVEREIKTAKNLTPEAKEIIRKADTKLSKKAAMELSRLEPGEQRKAAELLAAKEIQKVGEYTEKMKKKADDEKETEMPAAVHTETQTQQGQEPAHAEPHPDQGGDRISASSLGNGTDLEAIIAELEDTERDCSGTPDIFLQEYAAFVQKFQKEISWYSAPYYGAVYPLLTKGQLLELKELTGSISSTASDFFKAVEAAVKKRGE